MNSNDNDKDEDKDKDEKQDESDDKKKPKAIWPWVAGGVVVTGFVVVVLVVIFVPAPDVWTDDAYVTSHYATIAPRISGQVATVQVEDNQIVHQGDVLARLDDRDYRTALQNDTALLLRDQAQADDDAAQIARLPAQVARSQSEVTSATAQLGLAQANARRYRNLASTGAGTFQDRQQADASLRQAQASVAGMRATLDATRRELPVLQARRAAALATVASDQAQLDQARLNLSYTRILAPLDGVVGERSVQVGNFVSPGTALMALVPLGRVFIVANYREEALRHVLPGQHVRIHVDAYDVVLDGVVDSVPPASGASFAPIQPNNATGNFTKIVQRLPVKIAILPGQNEALLLREGFSVETTIHTGLADVRHDQLGTDRRITSR